jgi:hypothetical protein
MPDDAVVSRQAPPQQRELRAVQPKPMNKDRSRSHAPIVTAK